LRPPQTESNRIAASHLFPAPCFLFLAALCVHARIRRLKDWLFPYRPE
jgi:uncharacterized membrane protein YbaN (DUF454 family)